MSKKTLGQFYTTKSDYILQGFVIQPTVISVIEPFVGNGDLLPWIGFLYFFAFIPLATLVPRLFFPPFFGH